MSESRPLSRRVALLGAVVLTALALPACDGGNEGTEASPYATAAATAARHNEADVTFAQDMIVHHRQAITMSAMAVSRGASGQVRELAEGCTDQVVAKRLGISPRSARRTAAEVMGLLGARSRFQAGVLAAQLGHLPGPDGVPAGRPRATS